MENTVEKIKILEYTFTTGKLIINGRHEHLVDFKKANEINELIKKNKLLTVQDAQKIIKQ